MTKGKMTKIQTAESTSELDFDLGKVKEIDITELVPNFDEIEGYEKRLEAIEEAIGQKDIEYGVIISPEGEVVGCFEGESDHVSIDASRLPGNVFTHNHPRSDKNVMGGPFSPADMNVLARGAVELRAVSAQEGDKGVYSMKPGSASVETVRTLAHEVARSEENFRQDAERMAMISYAQKVIDKMKVEGKWSFFIRDLQIELASQKAIQFMELSDKEKDQRIAEALWDRDEADDGEKNFLIKSAERILRDSPRYQRLGVELERAMDEVEKEYRSKNEKTGKRTTLFVSKKWQIEVVNRQLQRVDKFYQIFAENYGLEYSSPFSKAA